MARRFANVLFFPLTSGVVSTTYDVTGNIIGKGLISSIVDLFPVITLTELKLQPGAEYDFPVTNITKILTSNQDDWSGNSTYQVVLNSDDGINQASIILEQDMYVSYCTISNLNNKGPGRIFAEAATCIDGGNNTNIIFTSVVERINGNIIGKGLLNYNGLFSYTVIGNVIGKGRPYSINRITNVFNGNIKGKGLVNSNNIIENIFNGNIISKGLVSISFF